ncbi:MAG: hypothetical protein O9972_09880 [Burkholderiales bacterium]|nr:hypothetical protein [Burkholderiales bacterium]
MSATDRPPSRSNDPAASARPSRRSIPDPREAPVDITVAVLRGVHVSRLRADALRERFMHPQVWTP